MMPLTVYMFHAIGEGDEILNADPHYSFSTENFRNFMSGIGTAQSIERALTDNTLYPILTFDDGHKSNYNAAKILHEEYQSSADFFINPSTVGTDGYLSWEQIREMKKWGMSIQSHGYDHKYMSDLSYEEQRFQLEKSKKEIEEKIGESVTIFAPPGGRYNLNTIKLVKEIGYQHMSISRPGKWYGGSISPRIAVLKNTSCEDLLSCRKIFSRLVIKQIIKYRITGVMKMILGNKNYDSFRIKVLGDGR